MNAELPLFAKIVIFNEKRGEEQRMCGMSMETTLVRAAEIHQLLPQTEGAGMIVNSNVNIKILQTMNIRCVRLSIHSLKHRLCVVFSSSKRLVGATIEMSRLEKLCLQWNDFQETILSCCKELRQDRKFTDE